MEDYPDSDPAVILCILLRHHRLPGPRYRSLGVEMTERDGMAESGGLVPARFGGGAGKQPLQKMNFKIPLATILLSCKLILA